MKAKPDDCDQDKPKPVETEGELDWADWFEEYGNPVG